MSQILRIIKQYRLKKRPPLCRSGLINGMMDHGIFCYLDDLKTSHYGCLLSKIEEMSIIVSCTSIHTGNCSKKTYLPQEAINSYPAALSLSCQFYRGTLEKNMMRDHEYLLAIMYLSKKRIFVFRKLQSPLSFRH